MGKPQREKKTALLGYTKENHETETCSVPMKKSSKSVSLDAFMTDNPVYWPDALIYGCSYNYKYEV